MKRFLLISAILLLRSCALAQSGTTLVTATVKDVNNNVYSNCQWSVVFMGQNTTPGAGPYTPSAYLNGQQGTCDSFGNFTVNLGDNINTITPTPSQWSFSICSASGYLGGPFCKTNVLITITGASQNLTSILTPLMPPLPQGGGGGSVVGTPNQIQVIAGQVSFPGTVIFPGSVTSPKVNNVVQLDGTFYPLTNAGLTAAIAAACNGTIPGKVLLPPTPAGTVVAISAQTVVPSNCTIQGPGRYATVLQAQSSYNAGTMFSISGKSNVKIEGFAIDANRASNSNTFEVMHIDNSTNVSVNEMLLENGQTTAISLNGTDANISIRNSEIKNTGFPLPSSSGGGIGVTPSGAGTMSTIVIDGNYIHGNNHGIDVLNSSAVSAITGLRITNNTVVGNADDGIGINAFQPGGGSIIQAQISNNESGCNGWLANGTGFSSNCTPDFLQTGSSNSTSGVGVDIIGSLVNAPAIVGNNVHDNVFDGISIGTQINATVNTSGSTITCATCGVSAPPLNTRWINGQIVTINASVFHISSCASITTCTTTTSIGTLTGAAFIGPSTTNASVTGNTSYHNIATGFFFFYSDSDEVSGNTANLNGLEGFGLDNSTGVQFGNDSATSNDTSNNGSHNAGFNINGGLQVSISGAFTNDYQGFQTQQTGVLNTGSSNKTMISSPGLNGPSGALSDAGTNTFYNNGSTISLGGQVFTWPAATGTLCTTTSCVGSVGGQIKGQPSFGATTTTLSTSAGTLYVSGFCGATLTCPNSTDESTAIQAAVTQLKNGGSSGATGHIIDDMCGVQTWSVEPFNGFAGLFETQSNCSVTNTHIISLDGVSTITMPSSMRWVGTGGNGFAQIPTNTWVQACNSIVQPCANSNGAGGLGFVVQQCAIGSTTYSAGSSQLTITCSSGAPFTTCAATFPCSSNTTGSLTAVNSVQQYRLLCINNSSIPSNNGCWTYKTTTSATAPQAFVVNVPPSGLASCAASCGTVYLDTPMVAIGNGGGGGVFHTEIKNVVLVGSYLPGVGGAVNGQGQEGTSIGPVQVFDTPAYYVRLDQSAAYGGASGGDTNSTGGDTWSGNMTPLVCKNATCACAGDTQAANGGHGSCSSLVAGTPGTVNLGDYIACGGAQGTTQGAFATISPDPCTNPNFVGFLISGASFNQGPGRIRGHLTSSISDKSLNNGSSIKQLKGSGVITGTQTATTASAFMCIGSHCTFDDTHAEYFATAYEVCGNSARNATWQLAYSVATAGGAVIPQTEGVIFDGGFSAFETGGVGFDIGQSGAGSTCGDISIRGVNVGLGTGNALEDNISGNSCSDATESYFLGHGTNPMFLTSCSTLIGLESPGLADSALNVNALPYIGALGVFTGLNAPTSPNGVPQSVIEVPSGGSGTPVQYALPGVVGRSVTGATATDTILATDCNPTRVTYLTTVDVAVTLPTAATLGVPNCTFKVVNGTATLHTITITPTTWTIGAGGGTPGASLALSWGQEAVIFVDPNSATNWVADVTEQGFTAGSGITITRSASGPSISAAATGANTALSNLSAVAINLGLTPGSTNTIDLGSNSKYWANLWATTVNCGIAATASCSISGAGSTSGTATITWPAIAGTVANPLAFSNALQLPVGAQASPALVFASSSTRGFYANSATKTCFAAGGGTDVQCYQSNADLNVANTVPYSWSSTAQASGNPDTGVSRGAALVVDMGNGTQGDTTAVVKAAGYMSVGTKFTTNSGCSETTLVGGATAGKFTSGSAIACTVIVTMGNTATAPNGWSCWFNDQTAIPAIAIRQTASNATTASFLMTVGSGDVIDFGCEGY